VPLGFVVAAFVIYFAEPTGASILVGLPIALTGAIFRAMAAGVIRKDSALATGGPYAWTRNPLYFGSSLLGLGFALMSGSWIAAAIALIPSLIVYPRVIRSEEAHLERLFPAQFAAYRTAVPRFIPRVKIESLAFSSAQYMANREYNTALGFAAALAVFVLKWRLI
jgi:protein-S-isoprenylcysteine O-methyltransferase Ste14